MYQINNSNRVSESDYSHMVREPRVPQAPVKVPRTFGWHCPYDNYKSEKHYNTQRHINLRHGSGQPIDSSTGLTREQKRRNALRQDTSSINIHGNNYNTNSSSRPFDNAQIQNNSGNQSAFDMPLLDDATKRVRELGYCQNVQTGIQKINKTPYGAVRVPGRAQRYMIPPHLQSRKGMNPANSPQPNLNPDPNPYNPTVPHSQYPLSDDLSEAIAGVPQNDLARKLALYNLMKGP